MGNTNWVMRRLARAGPLAVFMLLAACAVRPTPYQPSDGAFGYAQTQIDNRTWRVDFAGDADTPRVTVENYLLYRAAEIMLFGGHERFIVLEKEVERTRDHRQAGVHPYYIDHGPGPYGWRHRHGVPVVYTLESYRVFATVRVYSGRPSPAGLKVYAAREVIEQLGPSVILPD